MKYSCGAEIPTDQKHLRHTQTANRIFVTTNNEVCWVRICPDPYSPVDSEKYCLRVLSVRPYLFRYGLPWLILSAIALLPQFIWSVHDLQIAFPQIDKFQHFVAGMACGTFGAMLYPLFGGRRHFAPDLAENMTILLASLMGLAIGGVWEAAEATIPAMGSVPIKFWDTLADLIMDTSGAMIVGIYYSKLKPMR